DGAPHELGRIAGEGLLARHEIAVEDEFVAAIDGVDHPAAARRQDPIHDARPRAEAVVQILRPEIDPACLANRAAAREGDPKALAHRAARAVAADEIIGGYAVCAAARLLDKARGDALAALGKGL